MNVISCAGGSQELPIPGVGPGERGVLDVVTAQKGSQRQSLVLTGLCTSGPGTASGPEQVAGNVPGPPAFSSRAAPAGEGRGLCARALGSLPACERSRGRWAGPGRLALEHPVSHRPLDMGGLIDLDVI